MRELTELSDRELIIYTAVNVERIDKAVARVEGIVFGNGQPGLVTRIAKVEEAAEGLGRIVSTLYAPSTTKQRATVGGAISGFVALLLAVLAGAKNGISF